MIPRAHELCFCRRLAGAASDPVAVRQVLIVRVEQEWGRRRFGDGLEQLFSRLERCEEGGERGRHRALVVGQKGDRICRSKGYSCATKSPWSDQV